MVSIEVNDKVYKVKIADTEELRETGLQNIEKLPKDEGMLFVFDEPQEVSFWMKDTLINLDIIFIDEYGDVIKVKTGYANTEETHRCDNVKYVLELNQGSRILIGDEVDLTEVEEMEDEEEEKSKLLVIGPKGDVQVELKGGERIFSRPNTKTLVRLSKRAHKSKSDADYKALGRKVLKYLQIQNNKEEDYVELPE